jgi:hypothetical protein
MMCTSYAEVFVHDGDQRVTAERVKDKVQTLVSSGAINAFSGKTVSTVWPILHALSD